VTQLSSILSFVAMLIVGLLGGVFATSAVLDSAHPPGSLRLGPWVAWHKAGTAEADPYSLAVHARRGDIPMTPVEGLAFFATEDSAGARLRAACSYLISGAFPQARAWTLTVYGLDGRPLAGPTGRSGFNSSEALVEGTEVAIALSAQPRPGNWLPLSGTEPFVVALRLYETPLSAAAEAIDPRRLPTLRGTGCAR
jgi:hypothetical protein